MKINSKKLLSIILVATLLIPTSWISSYATNTPNENNNYSNNTESVDKSKFTTLDDETPETPETPEPTLAEGAGVQCVTFYATEPFTLSKRYCCDYDGKLQYLLGNPAIDAWTDWTAKLTASTLDAEEYEGLYYVSLRGVSNSYVNDSTCYHGGIYGEGADIMCEGNIFRLLHYEDTASWVTIAHALEYLFANFTRLVKAPDLTGKQPSGYAFHSLFRNCTNLEECPDFQCYYSNYTYAYMFAGCTKIKEPPATLYVGGEATTGLMEGMFMGCTSLLYPVTFQTMKPRDGATNCFAYMYQGCTSLRIYKERTYYAETDTFYTVPFKIGTVFNYDSSNWVLNIFSGCGTPIVFDTMYNTYWRYSKKPRCTGHAEDQELEYPQNYTVPAVTEYTPSSARISYSVDNGKNWYTTPPDVYAPGIYTVLYKVEADGSQFDWYDGQYTVNFVKYETFEYYTQEEQSSTYNGNPKYGWLQVVKPDTGYTIEYSTDGGETYSTTKPSHTDVGRYTVDYIITAPGYKTVTGVYNYTINKATMNWRLDSTTFKFLYDGTSKSVEPEKLAPNKPTTGYSIYYSTDNKVTYTENNPSYTEIGNYKVYLKFTHPGYNDYESAWYYIQIVEPKQFVIDSNADVKIDYDGKPHSGNLRVSPTGTISYSTDGEVYTSVKPSYTEPGTYPVHYKIEADGYQTVYGSYVIQIDYASVVVNTTDVKSRYNGKPHTGDIEIQKPASYELTFSEDGETYSEDQPSYTNVGNYTVYYQIISHGYKTYKNSFDVVITPANIIADIEDTELEYNGLSQFPKINVYKPSKATDYTILYSSSENGDYTEDIPEATDVGDYNYFVKIVAPNFNEFKKNISFSIVKGQIEVDAPDVYFEFDRTPKQGRVEVINPKDNYKVTYSTDNITYTDFNPSFTKSGEHLLYFKVTADGFDDYEDSLKVKIGTDEGIVVEANDIEVPYDGKSHTGSVTVLNPKNNYKLEYSTTETGDFGINPPEFTEIGEYDLWYKVEATGYDTLIACIKVKITGKKVLVVAHDVAYTYTGEPRQGMVYVRVPEEGAELTYSATGSNYTSTNPSFTERGKHTLYYKAKADGYETAEGTLIVTINNLRTIRVTADDCIFKYDGKEHSGEIQVTSPQTGYNIEYSIDGEEYSSACPGYTELGKYPIFYRVSAAGYNTSEGRFYIKINDREMVESVPIYVMLNPNSGEHLLTSKKNEYDKLQNVGWKGEGIAFYGYSRPVVGCTKIYRIFNPNANMGDHHYTKSVGEINKRLVDGWSWDFNRKAVFYAKGDITVYKLFYRPTGRHHYTIKTGEVNNLVSMGWENEGTAWFGAKEGALEELAEEEE